MSGASATRTMLATLVPKMIMAGPQMAFQRGGQGKENSIDDNYHHTLPEPDIYDEDDDPGGYYSHSNDNRVAPPPSSTPSPVGGVGEDMGHHPGGLPTISDSAFSLVTLIYVSVSFLFVFFMFCWRTESTQSKLCKCPIFRMSLLLFQMCLHADLSSNLCSPSIIILTFPLHTASGGKTSSGKPISATSCPLMTLTEDGCHNGGTNSNSGKTIINKR